MTLPDNNIAVLGLARSGSDLMRALVALGAGSRTIGIDRGDPISSDNSFLSSLQQAGVRLLLNYDGSLPGDCGLLITSPVIPEDHAMILEAKRQNIPVWGEVEFAYQIREAPLIAVTGTNGKSTTAMIAAELLNAASRRALLCGNIAADHIALTLTKAALQAGPADVLVAEISSFQLEQTVKFRPRSGVWTTLSPDHLNRHPDMESYARAKARMFLHMQPEDLAILPVRQPEIRDYISTKARIFLFDDQPVAENMDAMWCTPEGLYLRRQGSEMRISDIAEFQLIGAHNRRNLAAAAAACLPFVDDPMRLAAGIGAIRALPHRMEPLGSVRGIRMINNSMCSNLEAVIESLRGMEWPYVAILGGLDKSDSPFELLVPILQQCCKAVVVIGQDGPAIGQKLVSGGWSKVLSADDMQSAVDQAMQLLVAGDALVLAPGCASFGMFANFEDRGRVFREVVGSLEAQHAS